jgi:ATP-binding protein involved in chromosome partitioning
MTRGPDDVPSLLAGALDAVPDPAGGGGLLATGRAARPRFAGGVASAVLNGQGLSPADRAALESAADRALRSVPGVAEVRIAVTAERAGRRILAIGSGKGGVGKSTVAVNLAVAFARLGIRLGLVDADIYGPSQPRLLGLEGTRPTARDKVMNPVPTGYGFGLLSVGQLVEPGRAIAWRGPMAAGALGQLLDADWGTAELIVVDLPPGTGDVQLTMIQRYKPAGAVIVSTPQDLALIDATRATDLFQQAGVPILGVIENMAGYRCPHCDRLSDPFGQGGAEAAAREAGFPFLGRIPLQIAIRTESDAGRPPAAAAGPEAAGFLAIAEALLVPLNLAARERL